MLFPLLFIYSLALIFPFLWKLNSSNCTTPYHSLPGKRLLTFTLLLTSKFPSEGKKGPIQKQFDVFQLYISPSSESSELSAPIMNSPVTGIFHTTDFEDITLISQNLASIAIPYSNTNDLQAQVEPLSHVCTLHFEAPSERDLTSGLLEQVQQTISSSFPFPTLRNHRRTSQPTPIMFFKLYSQKENWYQYYLTTSF